MNLHRLLRSAEQVRALDRPAGAVARVLRKALRNPAVDGALRGSWLGHPVHPILVTMPIGAWVSSAVFDLVFSQPKAARRLQAIGLVAVPPTVLFGLADYSGLDVEQRRVGALHAAANAVSAGCFLAAWLSKSQGANRAWGMSGLLAVGVGGALGGHLSYSQGAGVRRWEALPFQRRPPVTDPAAAGWEHAR
ncbi:DUF2231 domain-containing protein [Amycolatopsis acidiphila]|uniref:DUF2231 domain-containing protein n=1 Tax=Amycolatopsis acidiphila TaxID=715473 RepID=UPI001C985C2C|nr:DUF2231 domain-containing protein [Amycolatopsis acidiphila]UIJ58017.1 DUF2231 domain-containing protein [Amycolatopsis acidiphila]